VAEGRARSRAIRARMQRTGEPFTVAARKHDERRVLMDDACVACLSGSHAACGWRTFAFGGPCSCAADQHRTLLAEPVPPSELGRYLT